MRTSADRISKRISALILSILWVFMSLSPISCSPSEFEGAAPKEGELPLLRLTAGDQSIIAMRNGFAWPSGSKARVVEENPFIPRPEDFLVVQPGQELILTIEGTTRSPKSLNYALSYHQDHPDPAYKKVIATGEVQVLEKKFISKISEFLSDIFKPGQKTFTFPWIILPENMPALSAHDEVPKYDLEVEARWLKPQEAAVKYIATLASPDDTSVKAAIDICRRFYQSAWSGEKDQIVKMIHPNTLREMEKSRPFPNDAGPSPFGLALSFFNTWDVLLWQSAGYSFKVKSGPLPSLGSIGPDRLGAYAQVLIRYSVEVTEKKTQKTSVWDYTESYQLGREDDKPQGQWMVVDMMRSAVPWQFSDPEKKATQAKEKGWEVSFVRETKGNNTVISAGDFSSVNRWAGLKWSDDKAFCAFVTESFGRKEIWVVGRDDGKARRVFAMGPFPPGGLNLYVQELVLLDWVPRQSRLRFMANGLQDSGPHAYEYGHWVGEIDVTSGEVQDVAFIPLRSPGIASARDLSVTKDRTTLIFRNAAGLWKVDLKTKEKTLLVPDVKPEGHDLFRLLYSPSGWYGAYQEHSPDSDQLVVYHLKTGEKRLIDIGGIGETEGTRGTEGRGTTGALTGATGRVEAGNTQRAFLLGWAPNDMLTVALARENEINPGEDFDTPAGVRAVRFYDVQGEIRAELFCPPGSPPGTLPGGSGKSIGHWVWTPDEKAIVFTVGEVVKDGETSSLSVPHLSHKAKEVWIWENPIGKSTGSSKALRKLADISEPVHSIEWDSQNQRVNIWYKVKWDENGISQPEQSGVGVDLIGKTIPLSRPNPYYFNLDHDIFIASLGGKEFFRRESEKGSKLLARDPKGQETVLLEGKFWIRDAGIVGDSLVVVTDTSRFGLELNRSRLYLIIPR